MLMDIVLLSILALGLGVGLLRGVVRQALLVGAWLVVFVVAAHLRGPAGDWLATASPQYALDYATMLAFLAIFLVGFIGAMILAEATGGGSRLTSHPRIDALLGGVLGLLVVTLALAAVVGILDTYFATRTEGSAGELTWLRSTYQALDESFITGLLRDTVNPLLGTLLAPLLPGDVSATLAA